MKTLILLLISLLFGQIIRLDLFSGATIYLQDIIVTAVLIFNFRIIFSGKIIIRNKITDILLLFLLVGILSLLFNLLLFGWQNILFSSLYLVRITAYVVCAMIIGSKLFSEKTHADKFIKIIFTYCFVFSVSGLGQYFLYPDLRNLMYLGWDPHFKRLFATLLDPNFAGFITQLGVILGVYVLNSEKYKHKYIIVVILLVIATVLTFSRSTYLSLFTGLAVLVLVNRKCLKTAFAVVLGTLLLIMIVPKPVGEGGKLERLSTVNARVENYRKYIPLFLKQPFLGYGFNTLKSLNVKLGFIKTSELKTSHSAGGVDNSFLFILMTTGVTGLILFLFFLYQIFKLNDPLITSVTASLLVHSLFQNTFFYPQIFLLYFLLLFFR